MPNVVRYDGETRRGPSPIIWDDPGKLRVDADMGLCMFFMDDFAAATNHASVSASGGYYTYQDTNTTITGVNAAPDIGEYLGALRMTTGKDNEECGIQFGYGHQYRIDNGAGNTGRVFFEARFSTNTIANNGVAFAIGLGGGPVAANHLIDNTGEINNTAPFIGFQRLCDDGDQLDIFYTEASQAKVTVLANAQTLVADTFYRVGFLYDPFATDSKKIRFFINGVQKATVNTTQIDTATFPEGSGLQPMVLAKPGANDQGYITLDWVAAAQYCDGR